MTRIASTEQMTRHFMETLAAERLIAVVRTDDADTALWASEQLIEAGFRVIEITLTVPDAPRIIDTLAGEYPKALIGAGTVLTTGEAEQAIKAGARFLVSPVLEESVLELGRERDVPVLPGAMTPSEVHRAVQLGAHAVKVFPASATGGPAFIRAVRGPMPTVPLVPTGGVMLEQVADYLRAGALAVGVGGPLLDKAVLARRDEDALKATAKKYLKEASHA